MEMFLFILTNIKLCNNIVGLKNTTAFDLKKLNVLVPKQRHYSLFTKLCRCIIYYLLENIRNFNCINLNFMRHSSNLPTFSRIILLPWSPLPLHGYHCRYIHLNFLSYASYLVNLGQLIII